MAVIAGVVKESAPDERRVAMVPGALSVFNKTGAQIVMEAGAGEASGFLDAEYSEKGVKLVKSRGEEASRIPLAMTQLFVAKAHVAVFDALREMLMWMSQDDEWDREIRDINSYYQLHRLNTFSLRRKIALHVVEAGGYAL